jgi:hypothetical protein
LGRWFEPASPTCATLTGMEKLTGHMLNDDGVAAVEFERTGSEIRNVSPIVFDGPTGLLDLNGVGFQLNNGDTLTIKSEITGFSAS